MNFVIGITHQINIHKYSYKNQQGFCNLPCYTVALYCNTVVTNIHKIRAAPELCACALSPGFFGGFGISFVSKASASCKNPCHTKKR